MMLVVTSPASVGCRQRTSCSPTEVNPRRSSVGLGYNHLDTTANNAQAQACLKPELGREHIAAAALERPLIADAGTK